jgi:dTMP kinase
VSDHTKPGGAFIAVEGGDGAGKGTVVSELASRLRQRGLPVLTTFEPGGTPEGQTLRELLLRSGGSSWEPWAELLLMTAARVQHVQQVIRPAVAAGTIVISDRFIGSTIAYQGAGRGLSVEAIEYLHREAVGDLWPDLTVLLDIDPAVGIRRSRIRLGSQASDEGRFEALGLEFHNRVRASFLLQASVPSRRHVVVDASAKPADVAATTLQAVQKWLTSRPAI